jgi:hypothetical protein
VSILPVSIGNTELTYDRFIGFSFFQSNHSLQGMQNAVFSIFMLTSILSSLVQQASRPNVLNSCIADLDSDNAPLHSAKVTL